MAHRPLKILNLIAKAQKLLKKLQIKGNIDAID
jgi:hypothetical protein